MERSPASTAACAPALSQPPADSKCSHTNTIERQNTMWPTPWDSGPERRERNAPVHRSRRYSGSGAGAWKAWR